MENNVSTGSIIEQLRFDIITHSCDRMLTNVNDLSKRYASALEALGEMRQQRDKAELKAERLEMQVNELSKLADEQSELVEDFKYFQRHTREALGLFLVNVMNLDPMQISNENFKVGVNRIDFDLIDVTDGKFTKTPAIVTVPDWLSVAYHKTAQTLGLNYDS